MTTRIHKTSMHQYNLLCEFMLNDVVKKFLCEHFTQQAKSRRMERFCDDCNPANVALSHIHLSFTAVHFYHGHLCSVTHIQGACASLLTLACMYTWTLSAYAKTAIMDR